MPKATTTFLFSSIKIHVTKLGLGGKIFCLRDDFLFYLFFFFGGGIAIRPLFDSSHNSILLFKKTCNVLIYKMKKITAK